MGINVLVFNCSQNGKSGNTGKVLEYVINGMIDNGADVETIYTNNLRIDPCKACTEDPSWMPTGSCLIEDDLQSVYPKLKTADIWLFATPAYQNVIHTSLRHLLDRLEPLFDPFAGHTNGTSKLKNFSGIKKKIALVATSNIWSNSVFDPLVNQFETTSLLFNRDFVGALLRPHVWALSAMEYMGLEIEPVQNSLYKAGSELITKGRISKITEKIISKDLVQKKAFINEINVLTQGI